MGDCQTATSKDHTKQTPFVEVTSFGESDSDDEDFDAGDPGAEIGIAGGFRRRLWRLLSTPTVEVLVGPSERRFWIHRGLLRRHSLYFRGMLRKGAFREAQDNVVRLPDDDVQTFAVFAEWLYVGPEADSGDIFVDAHGKDVSGQDDDFLGLIEPDVFGAPANGRRQAAKSEEVKTGAEETKESRAAEGSRTESGEGDKTTNEEEEEEDTWETGSTVDPRARHDYYDFALQFSCYVLADKLMAPEFKRHILDEIRFHGEFCNPSDVITDMIRYVYNNTVSKDDPLRRFCVGLRCIQMPIHETLASPDFQALMEEGGPLVRDVMDICKKHANKENWHDHGEDIKTDDGYAEKSQSQSQNTQRTTRQST